jgi:hypothetical protein
MRGKVLQYKHTEDFFTPEGMTVIEPSYSRLSKYNLRHSIGLDRDRINATLDWC